MLLCHYWQDIVLNFNRKYMPRLVISKYVSERDNNIIFTKDLPECTFMTLPVDQNSDMIKTDPVSNSFTKAFLDEGSVNET